MKLVEMFAGFALQVTMLVIKAGIQLLVMLLSALVSGIAGLAQRQRSEKPLARVAKKPNRRPRARRRRAWR